MMVFNAALKVTIALLVLVTMVQWFGTVLPQRQRCGFVFVPPSRGEKTKIKVILRPGSSPMLLVASGILLSVS